MTVELFSELFEAIANSPHVCHDHDGSVQDLRVPYNFIQA